MAGNSNNVPREEINAEQAKALLKDKSPLETFLWVAKEINNYSEKEWDLLDREMHNGQNYKFMDEETHQYKYIGNTDVTTGLALEAEMKGADRVIAELSKENERIVINSRVPIVLLKYAQLSHEDEAKFVEFVKAKDPIAFYVADTQLSDPLIENAKKSITTEELRAGASNSGPRHLIEAMGYLPLEFTEKELPQLLANSIKNNPNHNFSGISDKFSAENNAQLATQYKDSIEHGLERIVKQFPTEIDIGAFRNQLLEIPEVKKVYEMAAANEKASLNSPATPEAQVTRGQNKLSQVQADQIYAFMQDTIAAQQANQAPSQG